MVIGQGYTDRFLSEAEVRDIFARGLATIDARGKKVLVILPDGTRSGPIPLCFHLFAELLGSVAAKLDFLIALGTHQAMEGEKLYRHVGISAQERETRYARIGLYNHNWEAGLREIGVIPAAEVRALSGGLMAEDVRVEINQRIFGYDQLIICGPVFPHEVVGFSGGNKYFFPGIAGPEVINFSHWMAAVITNREIIGRKGTPTRKLVNRAAGFIKVPKACFSMVVKGHDDLAGLYFGSPEESQEAAVDLSAQVNITYVEKPYKTVLSVMPEIYDDIWTAAKGMYKMEPVVEDGGTIIVYAPHITEIAYTHGKVLDRIGYHVRDYFLRRWEEFRDEPASVMAHSTLLKGTGTYEHGVEKPRVNVVLATGIPRERCERVNLGYMDPKAMRMEEWMGREDEGILVVPRAGELLYRLKGERQRRA
jgi:nickel-dependent lactate racemase